MAGQPNYPARLSRATFVLRALAALLVLPLVASSAPRAQSTKNDPKPAKPSGSAELRIELTGGDTKVPIADASVYVKFTEDKLLGGKKIELNLKTNQNGVTRSPKIPKGRILIQIVAPGWKTFGQYYDIDQDEQTIQINLERPSNSWLRP